MRVVLGLMVAVGCALPLQGSAEEMVVPLAQSGDWITAAHRTSITAAYDACLTTNLASGVAFRIDRESILMRVSDRSWSLPAGVTGSVSVQIGDWKETFPIGGNDSTMVDVVLSPSVAVKIFDAMDKASAMTVAVGKAKPIQVSLSGSTRATNAFRTCGGMPGSKSGAPGSNPFE